MFFSVPLYSPNSFPEHNLCISDSSHFNSKMEERPYSIKYETLPYLSKIKEVYDSAIEINQRKIQTLLNRFSIEDDAFSALQTNPILIDYLLDVQHTVQKYFSDYNLFLNYYFDPSENQDSIAIVLKSSMDLQSLLKIEDNYFEEHFIQVYNNTEGFVTFRAENNGSI